MTKKELRELIRSAIQEYTGTGASGGNAGDGNSIPSPRPFADDESEIENYTNKYCKKIKCKRLCVHTIFF